MLNDYLALGAGVQSSTLALMADQGEITPKPLAGIFADTKVEPPSVYLWLDWLEKQLSFPVYRVSAGNLAEDALRLRTSKNTGLQYSKGMIPAFVDTPQGKGLLPRQCTRDYKITVIQRKMRELLGVEQVRSKVPLIRQWMGISFDELDRMKPAMVPWIEHYYPLVEKRITRQDCFNWMEARGYPRPPRSACVFCPYHSDKEWLRLKTEEPEGFAFAVEWEKKYQQVASQDEVIRGIPYLHSSLVPLEQVQFNSNGNQLNLFVNECEGMCGV